MLIDSEPEAVVRKSRWSNYANFGEDDGVEREADGAETMKQRWGKKREQQWMMM